MKKALVSHMMELIYRIQPELCIEIGVYGGSSIYPTAAALKFLEQGKVFAVDPWNTLNAIGGHHARYG